MSQGATNTYAINKLEPLFPNEGRTTSIRLIPSTSFRAGTILGQVTSAAVNALQTLTSTATGGTFALTYSGYKTTAIPYNATAAQVMAALAALPTIGSGQVSCGGGALPTAVTVTFTGMMAGIPVALITVDNSLATGGTVVAASTTTGVAGGRFKAYAVGNGDGSNVPKMLLTNDVTTDDRGNIMYGYGVTAAEWSPFTTTEAYYRGVFRMGDCVGIDANVLIGANSIGSIILGKDTTDPEAVFTLN